MADLTFRPEIEILSAADGVRRRHWIDADKLWIVEESFAGHRRASATARRHGILRFLLTTWRRQFRSGELDAVRTPMFKPLAVSPSPPASISEASRASIPEDRLEIEHEYHGNPDRTESARQICRPYSSTRQTGKEGAWFRPARPDSQFFDQSEGRS